MAAPAPWWGGWLALDGPGLLFLSITSVLFLAAALYSVAALRREPRGERADFEEGFLFDNAPEATFTACLLLFLAAMTLVTVSQAFGLLWVGVEATTLASAPLIYFHRHHRSLEATWKYLLICSVGIALALLGNFFLAVAAAGHGTSVRLALPDLLRDAGTLDRAWLKAAFLFFLVGYGTKMGLAPLHTWLPDAHSEAPSVVSALLSGALLNCALLGIVRAQQVCAAAGQAPFGQGLLVGFGLLSMAVAAVFIPGQTDYKRMLAYSSVEHIGIACLGLGFGGAWGVTGALLHIANHALAKSALFLLAGRVRAAYDSAEIATVRGFMGPLPRTGGAFLAAMLALMGLPPFGLFTSEVMIFGAGFGAGRVGVAAAGLALLVLAGAGLLRATQTMLYGVPARPPAHASRGAWPALPVLVALLLLVLTGLAWPPGLARALDRIAAVVAG